MGVITGVRAFGLSVELRVRADAGDFDVDIGGSVAIDGVCLTVEKRCADGAMFFTAVAETLARTTFQRVSPGRRVNLERALRADGRLDGHIVLGHVDAVGRIIADAGAGVSVVRTVEFPDGLSPFIAEKGSVAVDGISLTVAKAGRSTFSLSLIPATLGRTTMSIKKVGDPVNIECDVLARYIYRMAQSGAAFAGRNGESAVNESNAGAGESLIGKMERLGF